MYDGMGYFDPNCGPHGYHHAHPQPWPEGDVGDPPEAPDSLTMRHGLIVALAALLWVAGLMLEAAHSSPPWHTWLPYMYASALVLAAGAAAYVWFALTNAARKYKVLLMLAMPGLQIPGGILTVYYLHHNVWNGWSWLLLGGWGFLLAPVLYGASGLILDMDKEDEEATGGEQSATS